MAFKWVSQGATGKRAPSESDEEIASLPVASAKSLVTSSALAHDAIVDSRNPTSAVSTQPPAYSAERPATTAPQIQSGHVAPTGNHTNEGTVGILADGEIIFGDSDSWVYAAPGANNANGGQLLSIAASSFAVSADPTSCVRSITFTIPGTSGGPGTEVSVVEHQGALVFTVDVKDTPPLTADLRALFFHIDEAQLPGLAVVASDPIITETRLGRNDVLDLGNGANLHGAVRGGFDIGVEFGYAGIGPGKGDVSYPVSFTLGSDHDLTLDALTHMLFGARLTSVGVPGGARDGGAKNIYVAPAAPDANDDAYRLFEDGATGVTNPSKVPVATVFSLLANDTDADGDPLFITHLAAAPAHGAVTIASDGRSVSYTPDLDFSGADSFVYCISDGNGGTDFATARVSIEAVADVPGLSYEIRSGEHVNDIVITVTATAMDADGSEFIDRIELGGIPEGVTVIASELLPAQEPGRSVQEYRITLPVDQDADFFATFSAFSREISNGDEESASQAIHVVYNHGLNQFSPTFEAVDQSMWGRGTAPGFDDVRFLGVDRHDVGGTSGAFYVNYDLDYKFGLQSSLHVGTGEVDASAPYTVDVETFYNRTTDVLRFETSGTLNLDDAVFTTQTPILTYMLDLIAALRASVTFGASIDIPGIPGYTIPAVTEEICDFTGIFGGCSTITLFPEIHIPGIPGFSFGGSATVSPPSFDESIPLLAFDGDSLNLLGLEGDSKLTVDLGKGFSIGLKLPVIETESEVVGDHLEASGSDNFLSLTVDVDSLVTTLLGIKPNPFGDEFSFDPVTVGYDLLNYEIEGLVGVGQEFTLQFGNVTGTLHFEDGYEYQFVLGSAFNIVGASSHDANQDGQLDISLVLVPDATFASNLLLTFELTHSLGVLAAHASVEVPLFDDPEFELGPVVGIEGTLASTSVGLVSLPPFKLDLGLQTETFHV